MKQLRNREPSATEETNKQRFLPTELPFNYETVLVIAFKC